jgi:hypothetical protein
MTDGYQDCDIIDDEDDEAYLSFEVFWRQDGWFWRSRFPVDAKAVGPFTTSTEAYQSGAAGK